MTRARSIAAATLAVAAVTLAGATASGSAHEPKPAAPDDVVASWDAIGNQALTASGLTFAEGHVIFAYEAVAVYDAVTAVQGGYRPFAVAVHARHGASGQAAAAAAAHLVLAHYLPDQAAAILDPAYAASLAAIPDGRSEDDGVAVGEQVALRWLALRAGDGFRTPLGYTAPDPPVPGVWIPTAPPPAQPIGTYLAQMRPFSLASPDQFRPSGRRRSRAGAGLATTRRRRTMDPPQALSARRTKRLSRASGPSRPCSRLTARSAASSSNTDSTSSTPRDSWR
jgi:hypothetical protein